MVVHEIVCTDGHHGVIELLRLARFSAEDWNAYGWLRLPALQYVGMQVVLPYVNH